MGLRKQKAPFDSKAFLARANDGQTVATYAANQDIYQQGDASDSVFYIQKGKVKLSVSSEEGKEAIVSFLKGDEFFGEACADGETLRLSTATTLSECTITRITKAEIHRLISAYPDFAAFFIAHLLAHYSHLKADLARRRSSNFGEEGEPEPLLAKISQAELAELIPRARACLLLPRSPVNRVSKRVVGKIR